MMVKYLQYCKKVKSCLYAHDFSTLTLATANTYQSHIELKEKRVRVSVSPAENLPMAVGEAGVRGGRVLRRGSGRNGSRFVVLRVQSPVVDLQLGIVSFGRTFDVHERHRARHRDLAGLLLGAPRQQFDTLHAAIPATTKITSEHRQVATGEN